MGRGGPYSLVVTALDIYLDNNATTRPCEGAVRAAEQAARELWHNPSSVHRPGQRARHAVELARERLARLVGCRPRELVFTGSGTESIGMALRGVLDTARASARPAEEPPLLVTSGVEHAAVRDLARAMAARGEARVRMLRVGPAGVVDLNDLDAALAERPALVSVQWANNETGVVQPVGEIGRLCARAGVVWHCDATQWVGKEPCTGGGEPLGAGLVTFSPHKFHGLKGVGCLVVRAGVRLRPQTPGSQELGRRGGTENVPAILAAGAAADEAAAWLADPAGRAEGARLRDALERAVLALWPAAAVNGAVNGLGAGEGAGAGDGRLWNTVNVAFAGLASETLLIALSERGVCASAGAACSSGSVEVSPVLRAMGVPEAAALGSVRFSLSRETTAAEVEAAAGVVAACVERLGRVSV